MHAHLGPLERTGIRWVIGDPGRKGGAHLELCPDGLRVFVAGEEQERVAWWRFMGLSMEVTTRRWSSSRTAGTLNAVFGDAESGVNSNGSCLTGMLRTPYEPWVGRFSHHARRYSWSEIMMAEALLRRLLAAKSLQRLGDAEWLDRVVARLTPERPRTPKQAGAVVASALGTETGIEIPEDRPNTRLSVFPDVSAPS
ncbi:hypothetical protein GCM10010218_62550 [Streptomyces mashuensis]|uniref:Uncharacterized protein n=1 Tax=Streptomyces mashuensis TaxID=33904 RepID=A0A919B8S1_9ACTN|nr:hypothetical protein [Streptomyces mashuensis]GHF72842.1 hypothetical protein GCM10010218_62550 [Streptomyces mashuensis]